MNWTTLLDGSVITAVAGGLITLIRGWTVMRGDLISLKKSFETCQQERGKCREDVKRHHEQRLIHIDPERDSKTWELLIEKIDRNHTIALENHRSFCTRMDRLEAVLLKINGGGKA